MAGSGLGGKYALIGMAESDVGIVPDKSPRELCVQVTLDAVRDAGLKLSDVDGLITCNAFAEPIMYHACLLYTSPSPRDKRQSRMPSSA